MLDQFEDLVTVSDSGSTGSDRGGFRGS